MQTKHIELALQGGGAQGAFTWGVLDRLLEDERIEIEAVSGASAGAMNAVVLADGLMRGGRQEARDQLRRFWNRVSTAGAAPLAALFSLSALQNTPLSWYADWVGRTFSPYQLNPLDINPLRDIIAAEVDFDRVRACKRPKLYISATNVHTGRLREFRSHELTADAVMASACVPTLFRAVEIDGEAYWDGGYTGNPALLPLVQDSGSHDLVLVQINPDRRAELPVRAEDILDRLNEITFNSSLIKELRSLALLQQALHKRGNGAGNGSAPLLEQVMALRTHRIAAEEPLSQLGDRSSTHWSFLTRLHQIGYEAADEWIDQSLTHVGRHSTFDLKCYL